VAVKRNTRTIEATKEGIILFLVDSVLFYCLCPVLKRVKIKIHPVLSAMYFRKQKISSNGILLNKINLE